MGRVASAISWSGTDVTMSMFVLSAAATAPPLDLSGFAWAPEAVRTYEMVDDADRLDGRRLYEYDLVWKEAPSPLEDVVTHTLRVAVTQGAPLAWFAFEGSFSFDHLLDEETAEQVYAVATVGATFTALDDEVRSSQAWQQRLSGLLDQAMRLP